MFDESQLWQNIFAREQAAPWRVHGVADILSVAINKYVLLFLPMLFFARGNRLLTTIVAVVGTIGVLLSFVHLFDMPQLWGRFLGRGIDPIWVFCLTLAVGHAAARWFTRTPQITIGRIPGGLSPRSASVATVLICAACVLPPAYGFAQLSVQHSRDESRFLPDAVMQSYRWIDANVPKRSNIATLNWEDISLLPIYTDADLVVGHNVLDGRSPADELRRFVETWRFLGRSRAELEHLLDLGPKSVDGLTPYGKPPPYLDPESFTSSQLMLGVLYWPYINQLDGIPIVTPGADPAVTAQLREVALNLFDRADPDTFLDRFSVDYVLADTDGSSSVQLGAGLRRVFSNGARIVYERVK